MNTILSPCRQFDVERAVMAHLEETEHAVTTKEKCDSGQIDIVARKPNAKLIIEAKGEDKGGYVSAEMNFQVGIGQIASRMYEPDAEYYVAFPLTDD